jgi:glycosyltransferase involved in cell wall biosynthesis
MDISVYVTSYNQKQYLIEAIDSVLAQTLAPSQVIVVDDCSQDGSQQVIAGYKSRYPELITPIYHAQNQGVARARADALEMVTGEYVTYVDGDDRYLPTKLEKEAAVLEKNPDTQIAFSNNYYMTNDGRHTGTWITTRKPPQGNVFRETLVRGFPRGMLFRMELVSYSAWKQVGFHDTNLRLLEDWDMRIRLAKRCRVVYCDEPLTEIRSLEAGLSSLSTTEKIKAFDYIWEKNKVLLGDLDGAERARITSKMNRLRAEFIRRQAKEELGAYRRPRGSRRKALEFYRESLKCHGRLDLDLLLGLFLPYGAYRWLRTAARHIRDVDRTF